MIFWEGLRMLGGAAYLELTREAILFRRCFLVCSDVNSSPLSLTPISMIFFSSYGLHPPDCKSKLLCFCGCTYRWGIHVCVCAYAHEEQRSTSGLVSWEAICLFLNFFLFFEIGSLIGPEFTKSARLTGHCSPGTHIFPVHKSTSLHTMPGSFLRVFRDSNSCFHSKHFPDWVISSSLHLIFLK